MLIEFKIQLDGTGAAKVTQAEAAVNPNAPPEKQLGTFFVPVAGKAGGSAPIDGPGTGQPGASSSSGSGMVFVIGPIVICGSGPGHIGPGGSAPIDGPGTGPPKHKGAAGV
jgi:hypothetical protein